MAAPPHGVVTVDCAGLYPDEIEKVQRLLHQSPYAFDVKEVATSRTDSSGGSISFLQVETKLFIWFSLKPFRTQRGAVERIVKAVDETLCESAHKENREAKVLYGPTGEIVVTIQESTRPRSKKKAWSLERWIAVCGLVLAAVAVVVAVLTLVASREARQWLHLEKKEALKVEIQTAPQNVLRNSVEPTRTESPSTNSVEKSTQKTTAHVKGDSNVAGNNVKGNNNVTGSGNTTAPTAVAPSGIAIAGGTVTNPTVNNYAPASRRLSDEQKTTLVACLRANPGTFTVSAISNNGEAYQYASDLSGVLISAGWKNEQPIPVAIIIIAGGMWTGVRISVHGTWDETTKTASLIAGASETTGLDCLRAAKVGAAAIPWADMKTGSIRIDVSERPQ
jgi:ribosomal protein S17